MSLSGRHILLGVTGSIAAYKAAMLVRSLVRAGAEVRVVMTRGARDFVTPLTLATLCKHPVLVENFDPTNGSWNSHVSLGEWADHYLIAPATANTLAKMTAGVADNLLLCSYLSARCPVSVAPAMDLDMYRHPATQKNLRVLREEYGVGIIEPAEGELASGLVGKGRMAEPEDIVDYLCRVFEQREQPLRGRKILVTAGATVEPIDPVRFVSNYSTGKMGYALAEALAERGAEVVLVSGRATARLTRHDDNIEVVTALSAAEMYRACAQRFEAMDGAVFCAAVADYTPAHPMGEKYKHQPNEPLVLELEPTVDIAAAMGRLKRTEGQGRRQVTIGFALETAEADGRGREYAKGKLVAKNLDAIVLNSLSDAGAGFGTDTNRVTIIGRTADGDTTETPLPLKSKREVAEDIADYMARKFAEIC